MTVYECGGNQEESLYYENLRHIGEYPIIGLNTFPSNIGSSTTLPKEVICSTEVEKLAQFTAVENFEKAPGHSPSQRKYLAALMETVKTCVL